MLRMLAASVMILLAKPVFAERVVMAISSENVAINSNFSGTDITVFGSIERDRASISRPGEYDVVVVFKGPPVDVVTRKKERIFGVWINRNSRTFLSVPSFYALAANRPPEDIAQSQALQANQIGLENILGWPIGGYTLSLHDALPIWKISFFRWQPMPSKLRAIQQSLPSPIAA